MSPIEQNYQQQGGSLDGGQNNYESEGVKAQKYF